MAMILRTWLLAERTPHCASYSYQRRHIWYLQPIMLLMPGIDVFAACYDVDVADFNGDENQDLVVPLGMDEETPSWSATATITSK